MNLFKFVWIVRPINETVCGDCLEVMADLPDNSVDLVLADPPYGTTDRVHPTQKPVALMKYLIKTYTNEGETVLDFACGSGTTCVACVDTNRKYIGIEQEPKYKENETKL